MNRVIKLVPLLSIITVYLLGGLGIALFVRNEVKRRKLAVLWLHQIAPIVLGILGIRYWIEVLGGDCIDSGTLLVSNHVSYTDILILAAIVPTVFVTSVEVRDSPFLGWLAKSAGCLFVERRKRSSLKNDLPELQELLVQGFNVVLFPEGTTSNGKAVLPFRNSLVSSALTTQSAVLPVCLNYRLLDEKTVTQNEADILFYYGEMDFFSQLMKLLAIDQAWAQAVFLPSITTENLQCRKELTMQAYNAILSVHRPIPDSRELHEDFLELLPNIA